MPAEAGKLLKVWSRVFWFLASLKLAIIVLLSLAMSLAAGTFLESLYDTPTAQYWVYRAFWFRSLLALLGVNIFTVALSRYPWKRRHFPFLLAHLGILILLSGAWITDRVGLDGMMRVSEGESSSTVEVDSPLLYVNEGGALRSTSLPWLPPGVSFHPFSLTSRGLPYDLVVDRFISHADPEFHFFPAKENSRQSPAVQIKISGGAMRINQEFWLWHGQPGWNAFQAGPAWLAFGTTEGAPAHGPRLFLTAEKDGSLSYRAVSSSNQEVKGRLPAGGLVGKTIQTPWRGGIAITIQQWVPDADLQIDYKPSRLQYRDQAPPSAIHLKAGQGGPGAEVWLGLGERAILKANSKTVEVGYFRKRVMLPFAVRLERFNIERYEGTMNPASYASTVTVLNGSRTANQQKPELISMNEPLKVEGVTLYQASYEDAMPRPVTSIFSVNRDPGRPWKYVGSILIVLGSILLFASKYRRKARETAEVQ